MFTLVAAISKNNGLGLDNSIPWHSPQDLRHFLNLTMGNVVIMGNNTFKSLKQPLGNRINIVLSKNEQEREYNAPNNAKVIIKNSEWKMIEYCSSIKNKELFIIGGSQIYKLALDMGLIYKLIITIIPNEYKCDTFLDLKDYPLILEKTDVLNDLIINTYIFRNEEESKYIELGKRILLHDKIRTDRTGVGTYSIFGQQLKFNLQNNTFPLITTRRMFFRGIVEELLFFLSGKTDSSILEEKNIHIWKPNTTREFLDKYNLQHLPVGDMGPSYGFLFRHFGAEYKTCKEDYKDQGFDQLKEVIRLLKTDPTNRRMIISLWDPNSINKCPLPPCLYNYQFYTNDKKLSCMMTQRSSDYAVAGAWNIATGALLTYLIASIVGMEPCELIWNIGDTHIYSNLVEEFKKQLEREPRPFPKLLINKKENLEDYTFQDFTLLNYNPLSKLEFQMAV
jgi:thymidylate synthase/dihydrofolate reductase